MAKTGYLYVLVHPSDLDLYKVGVTILEPGERLAQHNRNFGEYAGNVVQETGQLWELKTFAEVADPYWAEKAFWGVTPWRLIPFQGGVEVRKMEWKWVQQGLDAATKAGTRLPPPPRTTPVRDSAWMMAQLEGTGITMIGRYRGLVTGIEFQCEKGHVFKESAGLVANKKTCPCCVDWKWTRGPRAGLRASLR
jgi:hypothetical protein